MNKRFLYFPPRKWYKSIALSTILFMAMFMANSLTAQTVVLSETQVASTMRSINNYSASVETNMKIQKQSNQQDQFELSQRLLTFYKSLVQDIRLQKAVSQSVLNNLEPTQLVAFLESQSGSIGSRNQIQSKN